MSRRGLSLGLAFLATGFVLACQDSTTNPLTPDSTPQFARGGIHGPPPPDGDDGTTQECQIGFELTFDNSKPVKSDSDIIGTYENGVDKVQVGTGSGPGFRFDTNGNQKLEGKNDKRLVTLNFPSHDVENESFTFAGQNVARGIDLRFDKSDGGLNLCALNENGGSGTVPMTLRFAVPGTKDGYILRYGGTTVTGADCGVDKVVTVTRTDETTWGVASGPTACLLPTHGAIMAVVAMPFAFTITAQP